MWGTFVTLEESRLNSIIPKRIESESKSCPQAEDRSKSFEVQDRKLPKQDATNPLLLLSAARVLKGNFYLRQ